MEHTPALNPGPGSSRLPSHGGLPTARWALILLVISGTCLIVQTAARLRTGEPTLLDEPTGMAVAFNVLGFLLIYSAIIVLLSLAPLGLEYVWGARGNTWPRLKSMSVRVGVIVGLVGSLGSVLN